MKKLWAILGWHGSTIEDQVNVIKTSGYTTDFYQTLDMDTKFNHWIERLT